VRSADAIRPLAQEETDKDVGNTIRKIVMRNEAMYMMAGAVVLAWVLSHTPRSGAG
jgi:hypothetical protein